MEYQINHVHIRSSNPRESASWYEKNFNAKVLWEREVMPGTVTVSMQVSGPVRLNISSQPAGSSPEKGVAELKAGFGAFWLRRSRPGIGAGSPAKRRSPRGPAAHRGSDRFPAGLHRRAGRRADRVGPACVIRINRVAATSPRDWDAGWLPPVFNNGSEPGEL